MVLIKENIQKKRQTWKLDHCYRKIWLFEDLYWQEQHVNRLHEVCPGYVKSYGHTRGTMWIDFEIIPGRPAAVFFHSKDFIKKIYNFCIENIKETNPYAHGDWALSNILINGDDIRMCDWDNLDIYSKENIFIKLKHDLQSAFGKQFDEIIT